MDKKYPWRMAIRAASPARLSNRRTFAASGSASIPTRATATPGDRSDRCPFSPHIDNASPATEQVRNRPPSCKSFPAHNIIPNHDFILRRPLRRSGVAHPPLQPLLQRLSPAAPARSPCVCRYSYPAVLRRVGETGRGPSRGTSPPPHPPNTSRV